MRAEAAGPAPIPTGRLGPAARLRLALGAALLATGCGDAPPGERLVLVTLDTLRADSLGRHTPSLDALAERGTSFRFAYATTSTTQPTHATLFTGSMPWHHGVLRNGIVLGAEQETLAEVLQAAGFDTRAVVSSFPLHSMFGYAQGFAGFDERFEVRYVKEWEGQATVGDGAFYSHAEVVTDRALEALDASAESGATRQFLWVHYFDPHDPYGDTTAPGSGNPAHTVDVGRMEPDALPIHALLGRTGTPELEGALASARSLYARDVERMDRALGRLFARLRADEPRYRTHLVVTADHGESFGEAQALGHGKRLTPAQVQVPLVIASPAIAPGERTDAAGSQDLARTLLVLAGVPVPDTIGGRDLARVDPQAVVLGMRRVFDEGKSELRTTGERHALPPAWFFRAQGGELIAGNGDELFVDDDPARPLEGERAESLRAAFRELERWLEQGPDAQELHDPAVRATLGALGYVED